MDHYNTYFELISPQIHHHFLVFLEGLFDLALVLKVGRVFNSSCGFEPRPWVTNFLIFSDFMNFDTRNKWVLIIMCKITSLVSGFAWWTRGRDLTESSCSRLASFWIVFGSLMILDLGARLGMFGY